MSAYGQPGPRPAHPYTFPTPRCGCPVERPNAPLGAYFGSPPCVLPEWHSGDHCADDGSTSPSYLGGAMVWWERWIRVWRSIGIGVYAAAAWGTTEVRP